MIKPAATMLSALTECISRGDHHEIEGFGVGGSHGQHENFDEYSDLDVFLLIKDGYISSFNVQMADFASRFGEIALFRGPVYVPNYGYSFSALYGTGLVCQFNVNSSESLNLHVNRSHTRVVFDQSGQLTNVVTASRHLSFDIKGILRHAGQLFWFRVINTWRALKRGHLWFAIRHLGDVRQQMFVLARIVSKCAPHDYIFAEKAIERDVCVYFGTDFSWTLPTYSLESVSSALAECAAWFNHHGPQCFLDHDEIYPNTGACIVMNMLESRSSP